MLKIIITEEIGKIVRREFYEEFIVFQWIY